MQHLSPYCECVDDLELICMQGNDKAKILTSTRELTLTAVVSDVMIDGVEVILRLVLTINAVQFWKLEGDTFSMCLLMTETDNFR